MNTLLENEIIEELPCGSNFAYVLNDNSHFLLTDYKILQNQTDNTFVKCLKISYNGKTAIYYLLGKYKAFSTLLPTINTEDFMAIVSNLFSKIIEVKNNGFLTCQNIEIAFDKIFVDTSTLEVNLIYIPVSQKMFDDYTDFENKLRISLAKVINSLESLLGQKIMQLEMELSNEVYSLESLYKNIKNNRGVTLETNPEQVPEPTPVKKMKVIAMNAPVRVELVIDKLEYKLGKNPSLVDGAIIFNPAISRLHCKITQDAGQFFITDLDSVNGTYVNKEKLLPNQSYPIHSGDMIRLANSDFQILME